MPGPEGVSAPGGCLVPEGLFLGGGSAPREGPGGDPPGRSLLRAICILLECILVLDLFFV